MAKHRLSVHRKKARRHNTPTIAKEPRARLPPPRPLRPARRVRPDPRRRVRARTTTATRRMWRVERGGKLASYMSVTGPPEPGMHGAAVSGVILASVTVATARRGSALSLHCHLHCQPLSLSGLARPQSTSTAWDRLVSTFSSSRSSDLRPRVALWLPRRV